MAGCYFLLVNPLSGAAVEPWLSGVQQHRRKHLNLPSESQLVALWLLFWVPSVETANKRSLLAASVPFLAGSAMD